VTDAESTPITGIGKLATNDGDDGTYAALNDAALVISEDQMAWTGPASRPLLHAAERLRTIAWSGAMRALSGGESCSFSSRESGVAGDEQCYQCPSERGRDPSG
jgi:hypothetical protein